MQLRLSHWSSTSPESSAEAMRRTCAMPKDSTSLSYGRVVHKHARHNNCMGDFDQAPNIAAGRGTVVNFQNYPHTARLRAELTRLMNAPTPLVGELNHYFDANKCGIGWHGACAGLDPCPLRATRDSPAFLYPRVRR